MNYLPINIRVADRNDLEIILDFILVKAQFDREDYAVQTNLNKLDKTLFGDRPLAHVLLAELDNHPVGFALFFYTYSSFLAQPGIWLDDLFVQPQMRHQGIGTALIKHLISRAKTEECGRIEWTVAVDNHPAIDFYQQQGAEILQQVRVCRLKER